MSKKNVTRRDLNAASLGSSRMARPNRQKAKSAAPGPMDTILLKDYQPRSSVVVPVTSVPKAMYPAIDVHSHGYRLTPENQSERVKMMDEVGVELAVVLSGWGTSTGAEFDRLVDLLLKPYPTRFQFYCGLEMTDFDKADYPERAVAELVRCYEKGARGVGELVDKGSGLYGLREQAKVPRDKRLHPDDPRLDLFWDKCAELKLPVNLHIADHPSVWTPPDVHQERTPNFQRYNQYGGDGLPYEELLAVRDRTLEKHPNTIFIACHLNNQGNDLGVLGKALDKYPNLYLDISARHYEVGRTPRAAAKFLAKYANRVLFGSDLPPAKSMYQMWWRLFETADEYMDGPSWWELYGLELPASVLKSLYRDNAKKIMNWEKI